MLQNRFGIELAYHSANNTLRQNIMSANTYNFGISGEYLSDFIHNIDTSNKVNNKSILYLIAQKNLIINRNTYPNIGYLSLVNCENITVNGLLLQNNLQDLLLAYTDSSFIEDTVITDSFNGIKLVNSKYNVFINNTLLNNRCGIYLCESNNNTLSGNIVDNDPVTSPPIAVRVGFAGIWITNSNNNILTENTVKNSEDIGILLYKSTNNRLAGNSIINSKTHGIYISSSNNNIIYHNNLIDNSQQIFNENSTNIWNAGYLFGGNFWSDFKGTDYYCGVYQNETGSDGVGDTPYIIDENNMDRYPLMGPFTCLKTSVGYYVDVISNSSVKRFAYIESNSTIIMWVSNRTANQTAGFCRLTIPHQLMQPPYTIKVNNTTITYDTIYENFTDRTSIIYFTYKHSTLKITVIPEFTLNIVLALMFITFLVFILEKRRLPIKLKT